MDFSNLFTSLTTDVSNIAGAATNAATASITGNTPAVVTQNNNTLLLLLVIYLIYRAVK